VSAAYLLRYG